MSSSSGGESPLKFTDDPNNQESLSNIQIEKKRKFLCFKFQGSKALKNEFTIALLVFGVIVSGSLNRVSYQVMTEPMRDFSLFLALFNSIVYVLLYFSILFVRYKFHIVNKDQLLFSWTYKYSGNRLWDKISPWKYFVIMGLMDGLGNILGLIAAPYLEPALVPLLSQTIVIFSVFCAIFILGTKFTYWQVWSVCLLLCGVMFTLMPTLETKFNGTLIYVIVMAVSTLPNAISFAFKEHLFSTKPDLDIFIVNSHGSLFQLLLQPIFLPLTLLFHQTKGKPFLDFIISGFHCFVGIEPSDFPNPLCKWNPYPYIVYITINLVFNILLLLVTKKASALLSFMAIKAILPISVALFCLPIWPFLTPSVMSAWHGGGLALIVIALVIYRYTTFYKNQYKLGCMDLRFAREWV